MKQTPGGNDRASRGMSRLSAASTKKRSKNAGGMSSPPPRRLTPVPGNWWQRWLKYSAGAKKLGLFGLAVVVVTGGLLTLRFLLTANKIIVRDNGAIALNEEVDPTQLQQEGDGRINGLLIGVGGESHTAGDLADSIVLVSLDPLSKDVTMLSIPRDLYLSIGDYGSNKINAAHAYGEDYDYPGGGPKLLRDTISQHFGIPIHYWLRVDFEGFRQAVNTVGGIDVDVTEAIFDYAYPNEDLSGFEPFSLAAGSHHLDGGTALKYARSRHTTSDFDRADRQQQLLLALKDKALSLTTLINPVKINSLLSNIGNHVLTNVGVEEITKLADMGKQIQDSRIQRASLDSSPENYLSADNINGISVLIPTDGDFTQLKRYIRHLMPDGYLRREAATIEVLNGTDQPGRAEATAELLRSFGYLVVKVENADRSDYAHTVIYDRNGGAKRYTRHYLERRFETSATDQDRNQTDDTDLTIIVGSDYIVQD